MQPMEPLAALKYSMFVGTVASTGYRAEGHDGAGVGLYLPLHRYFKKEGQVKSGGF
jgi:hypothetical protein